MVTYREGTIEKSGNGYIASSPWVKVAGETGRYTLSYSPNLGDAKTQIDSFLSRNGKPRGKGTTCPICSEYFRDWVVFSKHLRVVHQRG